MKEDVACATPVSRGALAAYVLPKVKRRPAPRLIRAFGEARTVHEWASLLGLSVYALRKRLRDFRHLPPEVALSIPFHDKQIDPHADPGKPQSWTWELLAYADDPWAQTFVQRHPGGATLEEVGEVFGLVRERVRQVEESAKRKFEHVAHALHVPFEELIEALRSMDGSDELGDEEEDSP